VRIASVFVVYVLLYSSSAP